MHYILILVYGKDKQGATHTTHTGKMCKMRDHFTEHTIRRPPGIRWRLLYG